MRSVLSRVAPSALLSLTFAFGAAGCSGTTEPEPDASTDARTNDVAPYDATMDAASEDVIADAPLDAPADAPPDDALEEEPDGSTLPLCGCPLGDGPYCRERARALATARGCRLGAPRGTASDLLACENGTWRIAEPCAGTCSFTADSTELDDQCVLPVCDCFVQVAYCGSGAARVAAQMGCRIPLLPEHNNDILGCPGGRWTVIENCPNACRSAPAGTPDSCEGTSNYRMPFDCSFSARCSSGNHTSNHDGKDEYAYDFAVPMGTRVRAMRGGTVLRVRNVVGPGHSCYDGGGSACANLANTVEIRHDDGTVGLYMHLSRGTVAVGARVVQGAVIGTSGNSGWSTGPHVHVQVQGNCGIWWCQSVPFNFVEGAISSGTTRTSSNNCN